VLHITVDPFFSGSLNDNKEAENMLFKKVFFLKMNHDYVSKIGTTTHGVSTFQTGSN
jgi:hypothetical protein